MAIGDNIKSLRKQKGMTQKQLADASGLVDSTLRTYELGKANPKPTTVTRIAEALGVSIAELYGVDWIGATAIAKDSGDISAMYQSILSNQGGALSIDDPEGIQLLTAFMSLNSFGRQEAVKRIKEMLFVPKYQKRGDDDFLLGALRQYIKANAALDYQVIADTDTEDYITSDAPFGGSYTIINVRQIVFASVSDEGTTKTQKWHFWYYTDLALKSVMTEYSNKHEIIDHIISGCSPDSPREQCSVVFDNEDICRLAYDCLHKKKETSTYQGFEDMTVLYMHEQELKNWTVEES